MDFSNKEDFEEQVKGTGKMGLPHGHSGTTCNNEAQHRVLPLADQNPRAHQYSFSDWRGMDDIKRYQ